MNQTSSTTLWGQGLPEETWWHVAVVNDGAHTTMYVEGGPTVDIANQVSSNGITLGGRRPHREQAAPCPRFHDQSLKPAR